ncbi:MULTISPECIES: flagellar basal-body rod protein FlgG [unclassified Sphingomonas]|uniref:flagellar basal-body rod protein FlgG n=1 Tax=unclassified Sphingomonas TaxID=196159 RepID=UPI0022B5DF9D|nr:flagellar basal-body rod protein FlgG [Sphingomonas sp. NIBR02145]WHU04778.1 flagellar basal-body rod protein FlgG [Sphingomonas sp. NIBR02145]|eukprot:TRINITY_DN67127_c0_g1_i1.p2 TRINITY_DN67127_c0_g1~~TRINITY_DN67127_c0_g1_i1.p2  ORF type:complete len:262 (-),score=49.67 TRINITY_DN67127_c0_g1_i1:58-843(-)
MRTLSIAATGMLAQQTNVDVISNNIANMNTTGFKRQRAEFQDLLYEQVVRPGSSTSAQTRSPTGIQIGSGVKTGAIYRINEQGSVQQTDNQYDLAIQGHGYFQITLPDGSTGYTRDGSFGVSDQGELVNSDGFPVQPGITVPQNAVSVTVSKTGQVDVVLGGGDPTPQTLGQLQLATFVNEGGLEAKGGNLFLETAASGAPIAGAPGDPGFGTLMQGFVEASNVNPVAEITALITAQRAYEMNSRVVKTADEMLATTSQLR